MRLKNLSILNFKNIHTADLVLSDKFNCFVGHNGMGKTNLLDAVYYLSFCRSAFNPIDSQVLSHDSEFMVLEGTYERTADGEPELVYCGMKRGQKKHFKRNKKEYKRLSEHIGLIPLVFVSPADSVLIDGATDERRKLLDVVISQYDNTYMASLTRYTKALQQRNTLLKQEEEPDSALMDIWEQQMALEGERIFRRRAEFVERIIPVFQRVYSQISGGHEEVSLEYVSHCQRGPLLDVIRRDRMKDRAVGYSLHGVHRDDLQMLLGGYTMRREGSQGQNKTYVLALKLAQFQFLSEIGNGVTPLLLLDDIFDKLDANRVARIIDIVSGSDYGQIFITDTNREHIDRILKNSDAAYKIFCVEDGQINEKED